MVYKKMEILPLNGRIVIVDDSIEQALPLMVELGKRRLSYSYYNGHSENLPPEGVSDGVRLVFLDINLIDNSVHPLKELYSIVYGVMNRLIGKGNLPYVLVCWSRNEEVYNLIIEKLNEDLKERRPVCSIPLQKSHFFTLDGQVAEHFEENIEKLFESIELAIKPHVSFRNLLFWENHIHAAVNAALEDALSGIKSIDWDEAADWIFTKWGQAYSGKNFAGLSDSNKLKSAFHTLNLFFHETVEERIDADGDNDVVFRLEDGEKNINTSCFNERLMFTICQTHPKEPGRIVITSENEQAYKESLCRWFNRAHSRTFDGQKKEISTGENIGASSQRLNSKKRVEIRKSWITFKLVINAPCDYAQDKVVMNKVIPGMFIKSEFRNLINASSDAVFVSPNFYYREKNSEYFFLLDFRYLTSEKKDEGESKLKLKQVVLAEILSKLARYINRQGLLTIESKT